MFDIGFSELVAVSLIALIVLGPKHLPEVARTAGRWMGQLRRFIADVKQDIDREVHTEDLAELRKLKEELNEYSDAIQIYREGIVIATQVADLHARSELQSALLEVEMSEDL